MLVLGVKWTARRVDVSWEGQKLSFSVRHEQPTAFRAAHARPRQQPSSPQTSLPVQRKIGADVKTLDWQRCVDAPEAAAEFAALADLIVRDVRAHRAALQIICLYCREENNTVKFGSAH